MSQSSRRLSDTNRSLRIDLSRDRFPLMVLLSCFGIELLLYATDYWLGFGRAIDIGEFRRLWSATIESSFPSFFSIGQTLLVGLTLWFVVRLHVARGTPRWTVVGWVVLACFFTYMAIDDGAKVHERMGTTLGELRDARWETDFPSYNWQYFMLPFFGSMGLFMIGFIWFQLRDRLSRALVIVAVGMLVVAVGIDFIEGLDDDHRWNLFRIIADSLDIDTYCKIRFGADGFLTVRHLFKAAEELFFEAGANSVLWFVFLRHLLRIADGVDLRFGSRQA